MRLTPDMRYAEIAVDAPLNSTFDYHIPPDLEGKIAPGHLVQIAFGTALQHGVILRLHDTPPPQTTKPVLARLDPVPMLSETQIALARWMSETYLTPIGACVWLWLPPGLVGQRDIRLEWVGDDEGRANPHAVKTELEADLVALLKRRGALRGSQLENAMPGKLWRNAADSLARAGVVTKESIIAPPRAKPKVVQNAALAIHPDEIERGVRALERSSKAADLIDALASSGGTMNSVTARKTTGATPAHIDALISEGTIAAEGDTLHLCVDDATRSAKTAEWRKTDKPSRILRMLAREAARGAGAVEVSWVYAQTGANIQDLKKLEAAELVILGAVQEWRDSLADRDFIAASAPTLTPEQTVVWSRVETAVKRAASKRAAESPDLAAVSGEAMQPTPHKANGKGTKSENASGGETFLLHGVTGSGKTEIYLRAIEKTLALGRSAIFLVPEISLTPQTIARVAARFGAGMVAVVHSRISEGERYDTWRRAREGHIRIVVGARSGLFTPLRDVGLIILDEEHDPSYKQTQKIPTYHARAAAEAWMRMNHGVVILGSATPDIETAYRLRGAHRLEMPNRIMGHRQRIGEQAHREGVQPQYEAVPTGGTGGSASSSDAMMIDLPPVEVVDMREELKAGNTSIFSRSLQKAIDSVLHRHEQAILFLNRRGQSTYVFCRDCGYVEKCPRCNTPLTYHRHGTSLRCHRCDYSGREPTICVQCQSRRIKYFGAGTQQVELALSEMFPDARVVRWDADSARSHDAHEVIMRRFLSRKADILVGTQMVAKGLDLPMVTLVGVISADIGLALPDFRAAERTFSTLTQVAGRAGRGLLGGGVILQTYQPEHYAIKAASKHDYEGFYKREIAARRDLGYPPFRRMVRIVFRFSSEQRARFEAERAADLLRRRLANLEMTGTEIIGPAPCFFTQERDDFRYHLLLRGPDPTEALRGLDFPPGWHVDVDPVEVL